MKMPPTRIVILGKTGAGKSSLANTIFGEKLFTVSHALNSETKICRAETKCVNGRNITLIDTPGFFDTDRDQEELDPEIVRCITECAPGPHAFLIVLKMEKFTEQEQAVINEIKRHFSEEVFKYATVVFTHGDQLPEGQTMEDCVHQSKLLRNLVENCGGRCHVIDNKYWNEKPKDEYRSNRFQVEELLKTIDKTLEENKGSCYTNEMLQAVEKEIQEEEVQIRKLSGTISEEEIREKAKDRVFKKLLVILAGSGTGTLLGALLGVVVMVGLVVTALNESSEPVQLRQAMKTTAAFVAGGGFGATGGIMAVGAGSSGPSVMGVAGAFAAAGALKGGLTGYHAAEGADTAMDAAKRAAEAVKVEAQSFLNKAHDVNKLLQAKQKPI